MNNSITYQYNAWDYLGNDNVQDITSEEILERYWTFWSAKMASELKPENHSLITKDWCIQDWVENHHAWIKERDD